MRTLVLLLLLLVPLSAAEADAVLRYPPQNVFTVAETNTTWNERSIAAPAGATLHVQFEVRVVGQNTLQQSASFGVQWWMDTTLLGSLNGSLAPGVINMPLSLSAVLPDTAGDRTLRMELTSGDWDPVLSNNDPGTTLLRIGDVTGTGADTSTRHPWLGPSLLAGLAILIIPLRWAGVRQAAMAGLAPVAAARTRATDTWQAQDEARRRMAVQALLATTILALLAIGISRSGRFAFAGYPTGALVIAAMSALVATIPSWIHKQPGVRRFVTVLIGALLISITWQQWADSIGFLRWPRVGELAPFALNGITVGALYALIALGYTMVYGILKFINFAHGDVFTWGGYLGWMLVVQYPIVGLPLALLWAIVATAGLGALIERVAYRPLRGGDRMAPLITAIAVSLLLASVAQLLFGAQNRTFNEPGSTFRGSVSERFLSHEFALGGLHISSLDLTILFTAAALMVGLHFFIARSRLGQAMRAVADDREAALTVGIPVDRVVTWTFIIGSALAAVGGVFWGLRFSLRPTLGLLTGIKAFTAAVVGGIGHIPGAFLGGFLIGLAENIGGQFIDSRFQNVIAFLILIIFLLVRPQGMFGSEVRRR